MIYLFNGISTPYGVLMPKFDLLVRLTQRQREREREREKEVTRVQSRSLTEYQLLMGYSYLPTPPLG